MADATRVTVPIDDISFDRTYYPRRDSQSPAKVQDYAASIAGGAFPPILLTHDYRILDGWHRWQASLLCGLRSMDAILLDTTDMDIHLIRRTAARANVRHGLPQTEEEVRKLIRDEYRAKLGSLDQAGREALKKAMALDYSRSDRYIRDATSKIDKDFKAELRQTAFQMWLACATQGEIARAVGYNQSQVSRFLETLQDMQTATGGGLHTSEDSEPVLEEDLREFDVPDVDDSPGLGTYHLDKRLLLKAQHLDDQFKPPLYNIWRQQERSVGLSHFGNSEVTWVDNLLYAYTRPFDIVIDPFAGSGSTIDLCKQRLRRYLVSDRCPHPLRDDIRCHDVTTGVLAPPSWKSVSLVYLDPPYWKQAEGQYSQDATDLANMDLETFTETLTSVILQVRPAAHTRRGHGPYRPAPPADAVECPRPSLHRSSLGTCWHASSSPWPCASRVPLTRRRCRRRWWPMPGRSARWSSSPVTW